MIGFLQWLAAAVLFLIALILALTFIPVALVIFYDSEAAPPSKAQLRWLFIRFDLLASRKIKKELRVPSEKTKKDKPAREKKPPEEFSDGLSFILQAISEVKGALGFILRYLKIYVFRLDVVVSGDDAMQTALKFGELNIAIYSSYALAMRILNISSPQISVRPDFVNNTNTAKLEVRARILPATLLLAALKALARIAVAAVKAKHRPAQAGEKNE